MVDNTAENQYLILWLTFFCSSISAATIHFTYRKCRIDNKSAWPLTAFICGTVLSTLVAYGVSNTWMMWPWMAVGWILMWAPGGCAGILLAYVGKAGVQSVAYGNWRRMIPRRSSSAAEQLSDGASQIVIAPIVWLIIAVLICTGVLFWCFHTEAGLIDTYLTWGPLTSDGYDNLLKAAGNAGRLEHDFPLFKQLRLTLLGAVLIWWLFAIAYWNQCIRGGGQRNFVYIAILLFGAVWQLSLFQLWPSIRGFG